VVEEMELWKVHMQLRHLFDGLKAYFQVDCSRIVVVKLQFHIRYSSNQLRVLLLYLGRQKYLVPMNLCKVLQLLMEKLK
jgi:hypothetical protein